MANVSIQGYKVASGGEKLKCFICGSIITERYYFLSAVKCTSGMKVTEVLGQLIGELFCVVVSESDVICRCCTSLLNTYDRLECLKNELCSIVRQNLNENYLSKQVADQIVEFDLSHLSSTTSPSCPFSDFELNQEIFSVKPDSGAAVSYATTVPVQADLVKLEQSSILQTAFESLQFDPSEFDQKETGFPEPVPAFPVPAGIFSQSTIENRSGAPTNIDARYIHLHNHQLSLSCSLASIEPRIFSKVQSPEVINSSKPTASDVALEDKETNAHLGGKDKTNSNDESLSDGDHALEPDSAENFYVQIVRESGETSRSVLTLDSDSAQVLKHNWEA